MRFLWLPRHWRVGPWPPRYMGLRVKGFDLGPIRFWWGDR